MDDAVDDGILSAPHVMEYPYRRSLGPVLGRFFTGLRDGRIEGNKTASGRVLVPPMEYDPETGEDISDDWVEVGPVGVVTSWTWIAEPRACHPSDVPFAYALIQLDGADTPMLGVVRADGESAMRTGMRVRVRWADERSGRIQDIAGFAPAGSEADA
jgi:uncharacterized OB-fold protein